MTSLNGDMDLRARMDTASMKWQSSPGGSVWRRRVHLVGEPESGQVTSVVRYEPGSTFPAHDHPEGEEILVLEGTFSDEHGDWTAGTYLLNPEGFRHAPFSKEGCTVFVKLRQYGSERREHVCLQTRDLAWEAGNRRGISVKLLYAGRASNGASTRESVRLEHWEAGAASEAVTYPEGVEIFVIRGSLSDEVGRYDQGTWLRLPPGASHSPFSDAGCELYVKAGAVSSLRSVSAAD